MLPEPVDGRRVCGLAISSRRLLSLWERLESDPRAGRYDYYHTTGRTGQPIRLFRSTEVMV